MSAPSSPPIPDAAALRALAQRAGDQLHARRWLLATAESCTGGWIAKAITDVAGSSQWFAGGIVAYSNACKQAMLDVRAGTLAAHGAVSREVALEMATGAWMRTGADVAVATTGIAGPGGGSPGKPVGTVWMAWACRDGASGAKSFHFDGDRDRVRRQAVAAALAGLLDLLA